MTKGNCLASFKIPSGSVHSIFVTLFGSIITIWRCSNFVEQTVRPSHTTLAQIWKNSSMVCFVWEVNLLHVVWLSGYISFVSLPNKAINKQDSTWQRPDAVRLMAKGKMDDHSD